MDEKLKKSLVKKPKQETLEEVIKPIGDFIIENATCVGLQDGAYYHYSEVCKLLKLQSKKMYSDDEVKKIVSEALESALVTLDLEQWFKQFKK